MVYCARNRNGLTTFANPYGHDKRGRLIGLSSVDGWQLIPADKPTVGLEVDLFGDQLIPEADAMTVGSITAFEAMLTQDPEHQKYGCFDYHFDKMREEIPKLPPDAILACWCEVDAPCHCDAIIRYYEANV